LACFKYFFLRAFAAGLLVALGISWPPVSPAFFGCHGALGTSSSGCEMLSCSRQSTLRSLCHKPF
jgi:hypothetical protein